MQQAMFPCCTSRTEACNIPIAIGVMLYRFSFCNLHPTSFMSFLAIHKKSHRGQADDWAKNRPCIQILNINIDVKATL